MSCAARLQRYDIEVQRAMWGGEQDKSPSTKSRPPKPQKKVMTAEDIMQQHRQR